ncbi:single-stranded DNA-binding protein [Streptomyces olivaceiscleroticus]|uniref:Single-stranded DNA-binding protein n=1 Tax=Streptomyces olivaceiscleroticus TaxID=68245 RepID=A0ABP3KQZ4_9ACTN
MTDTMVTLTGNAATAVEHRYTKDGAAAARFRMACTPRRFDREQGRWTDGPTSFYTVRAWRALADNLAASVAVGEPLLVRGRLTVREGENPPERGGGRWFAAEVDAVSIGHDLTRGTAAFRRAARATAFSAMDVDAATSASTPTLTPTPASDPRSTPAPAPKPTPASDPEPTPASGLEPTPASPGAAAFGSSDAETGDEARATTTGGRPPESGAFTNGTGRSGEGNGEPLAGIAASAVGSDSPEKVSVS